eukprot:COSAG04_NODE_3116_length_3151_cov_1.533093_3_plen_225_part_00
MSSPVSKSAASDNNRRADRSRHSRRHAPRGHQRRKLQRYRCHLGCILLKMAAISLLTGLHPLHLPWVLRRHYSVGGAVRLGESRDALDGGESGDTARDPAVRHGLVDAPEQLPVQLHLRKTAILSPFAALPVSRIQDVSLLQGPWWEWGFAPLPERRGAVEEGWEVTSANTSKTLCSIESEGGAAATGRCIPAAKGRCIPAEKGRCAPPGIWVAFLSRCQRYRC